MSDNIHTIVRTCNAEVRHIMQNPQRGEFGRTMEVSEELDHYPISEKQYECTCGVELNDLSAAVTHMEEFGQ